MSFKILWHTWIVVHVLLEADCVVSKTLVAFVDRRVQAYVGRGYRLQAFDGIRGSSFISCWIQTVSFMIP